MKTQLKITLLYTMLSGCIILLLSLLVYFFAQRFSVQDFYKRLEIRAVLVAKAHFTEDAESGNLINDIRNEHLEKLQNEREYFVPVSADGQEFQVPAGLTLPGYFYREILYNKRSNMKKSSIYYAGILYQDQHNRYLVIVAAKNEYLNDQLAHLRNILIVGFVLSILVMFTAGLFFAKQIFLPIRRMTLKVQSINTENLHLRLNTKNQSDEISSLAATFNNMLDRLETSFESQNNFVSNASHELSTPLTAIIGEAELALQKERSTEAYQQAMCIILKEAERLKAIIQSLLTLAQTGFDGKKQNWETIRIDELVWSAKSAVDRIYSENKIQFDYSLLPEDDEMLLITGNEHLLNLALTNIMLNACKYSNNQEVIVALAASNSRLIVIVKDKGIGIPRQELPYIYDPFFRASNTGQIKGYGIGLPLTRNIMRLHKGDIQVDSSEGKGTEVRLSFPLKYPLD